MNDFKEPRDSVIINYVEDDYSDQNRIFLKNYVGGEIFKPFIIYRDMKTKNPIKVFDLRHQLDLISPKIFN